MTLSDEEKDPVWFNSCSAIKEHDSSDYEVDCNSKFATLYKRKNFNKSRKTTKVSAIMIFSFLILVSFSIISFLSPCGKAATFDNKNYVGYYLNKSTSEVKTKVAIIGAGAGGSSAAYYLQKYTNSTIFDITIFEKNSYIGGRSTTIDFPIDSKYDDLNIEKMKIELGASIFTSANEILTEAVNTFGLSMSGDDDSNSDSDSSSSSSFAVWNGKKIVYTFTESSWSVWTIIKMLFTFGISVIKVENLKDTVVDNFINNFYDTHFPFDSLNTIVPKSDLAESTSKTAENLFIDNSISEKYRYEFIQPLTRVNYAQDLDVIDGLGALVTVSATSAGSVSGGNWQIFENFIEASNANLSLNTAVSKISKLDNNQFLISYNDVDSQGEDDLETFDIVILAAPMEQTNITYDFEFNKNTEIADTEYVSLHVTIFSTTKKISNGDSYFSAENVPQSVLTTESDGKSSTDPIFNSLNQIGYIKETKEYIYKIFSMQELDISTVTSFFKNKKNSKNDIEINNFYHKHWNSYPILKPITKFNEFELDSDGFYYLNSMESFISTMETSALAGANVAALISSGLNTTQLIVP
ncbi:catalytic activity protein [[Candida] boidinii]|nr:catalytic activity protein [[Candida] boidinii]OWB73625.1 catalytic activity protein [[Candida] boidinii]